MISFVEKPEAQKNPLVEKMTELANIKDENLNSKNIPKEKMGFL